MSKNKIFLYIKTNFNIFKQETTWKANSYPLELINFFNQFFFHKKHLKITGPSPNSLSMLLQHNVLRKNSSIHSLFYSNIYIYM